MSRYNSPSTSSSPLTTPSSSFNKDEVEKQIEEWKNKYLNKYICPISQQLMIDPVTIETGQTYDRKTIEEWLKSKNTCPITRATLKSKTLARNVILKDTIDEKVNKFIKKVIKHVKMWSTDINLIDLCLELINESLDLIKSEDSFKNCKNDLIELKFNILLNELNEDKLFNNYMKSINELQDLQLKLIKLKELENKLINDKYLQKYYNELMTLLIQLKNNDLIFETFTKYCKLSNLDNNLIDKILNYLETDEFKLDILIILFNESNYNRNTIFKKLLNFKIDINNNKFIPFIKQLIKEINLKEILLFNSVTFSKYIREFKNNIKEELIFIFEKEYKNNNDIKYLELLYRLFKNDKNIESQLLNEYKKLNLLDKFIELYTKTNENKLDIFNLMLLQVLQNQNKEIIELKTFINNNLLQNNNLENELKEWNKQIINNFKIKYPEYDYVNIINIETPLNVEKEEEFYSDVFEVFGLKWNINIYPKGDSRSNENECGIFLCLNSLQYKNENEEEKEISSIKIKYLIDSINLNDNRNIEKDFTKIEGWGNPGFKQFNFIPIIKNDKQIFSIVIGMKKLDIEFK
ncbi:hypothetical protein ABK040_014638 [Willaertia magna]